MFGPGSGVRSRAAVLVVVALAVARLSAGQAASERQAPVFGVNVEVVKLTVTVFDENGELVTDLTREDFRLVDDGEPRSIQFFARAYEPGQDEELALDLGLLMDTSESMIKSLRLSQHAATRFLDTVPRARDLLTIFFDQDIRVSRYDNENQQGLIGRIHDAKGGGNTALYDAVTVYLDRAMFASGRQVMVIFSDGEDSISSMSAGQVYELVRSSNVTIFPIKITGSSRANQRSLRARTFLRQLASLSGGQVFHPGNALDLGRIYDDILDQIEAQYVIGFAPKAGAEPDRFRKLKLEVGREDIKVRHRKGYYPAVPVGRVVAPPPEPATLGPPSTP